MDSILTYIYNRFTQFFYDKITEDFELVEKKELEELYDENSYYFDTLSLKEFVGYIPKNVNEPALKVFEEYGEAIERWTLWQSWYVNRKAINDPLKITFYNGMMMYIKVLNTMARIHKKTYIVPQHVQDEQKVETPWIDQALADIKEFNEEFKKQNDVKENQSDQSTETSKK